MTPVELLGQTAFPAVSAEPYFLTLGPYAFYWFMLVPQGEAARSQAAETTLTVSAADGWQGVFRGRCRMRLEAALPAFLQSRPWFLGKGQRIKSAVIEDVVPLPGERPAACVALVQVEYTEKDAELYTMAFAFRPGPAPGQDARVLAQLRLAGRGTEPELRGLLYDPCGDRSFVAAMIDLAGHADRVRGETGEMRGDATPAFAAGAPIEEKSDAAPHLLEQNNTLAILDGRTLLKLYRRVEEGPHPEVESLQRLASKAPFTHTPALLGVLSYHAETGESLTLGVVEEYVAGESDAWRLTLDALHRFFDQILTSRPPPPDLEAGPRSLVELSSKDVPAAALELLGSYVETARLMARRTADLHVALASVVDDPAFAPEPFTSMYQRSLYQSMRGQIRRMMDRLRPTVAGLPEPLRELGSRLVLAEDHLLRKARSILDHRIHAMRIRCHGDLQLQHLLSIGKDFLVVDFEGEPDRPLSHRRRKRSLARDLTGLHRSMQDAAESALAHEGLRASDRPLLEPWALFWQRWASVVFLKEYRASPGAADLLPANPADLDLLFEFYRFGWTLLRLYEGLADPSDRLQGTLRELLPPSSP